MTLGLLLLFICSLSITLSSCYLLLEPEGKLLSNKQKEDYLIIIADEVNNLPEPADALSYIYISDSYKYDYRVYDKKQGLIVNGENGTEYYKEGYMYNSEGKYKYKYSKEFNEENERAGVLKNAFVDFLDIEYAELYVGYDAVGIFGYEGTSLELILTDENIDKDIFGESCTKVNVSLYLDKEKLFKIGTIHVLSKGDNGEDIKETLGISTSFIGVKLGETYVDVYDWMSYPKEIDTYVEKEISNSYVAAPQNII